MNHLVPAFRADTYPSTTNPIERLAREVTSHPALHVKPAEEMANESGEQLV